MDLPNVSIGTIVAFAGAMDVDWLKGQGWLHCNGDALPKSEYQDLYFAIGNNFGGGRATFNLPDLRGRFERGVDLHGARDPGVAQRLASAPGGVGKDNPGSVQGYATARPVKEFKAALAGLHHHDVPHAPVGNNAYAVMGSHYGLWEANPSPTDEVGDHSHTVISGGDAETRPRNKYVFFIIKYINASSS